MTLREHILTLRANSGLSQRELGEKIGAVQSTVCSWESGQKTPSPRKLRALSEYFNVDLLAIKEEQDELVKKAAAKAPPRNPGRKKPASSAHGSDRGKRQRDALAKAQLAAALDDTGCRDLAAAVLALAVRDWTKAKKLLAKDPQNANARHTVLEVEQFIRSPMYKVLYNTPPERLLNLMREALCQ